MDIFTFASPDYYENISYAPISSEYADELETLLPETWTFGRHGVWMGANPPGSDIPAQGFKIHVSSIPKHAKRTLHLVVPVLVARGVSFKIAADPALLNLLISKRYGRGGSGKFMTIYPPTLEIFRELIEELHQATKDQGLEGPYILSDRRYADSRVIFYRYGGFRTIETLSADGSRNNMILDPDGTPVPDTRTPYFQLPAWVEDPFGGTASVDYAGTPLLKGRYAIEGVLAFSNGGGVYSGTDQETGTPIIVKEARPFSSHWPAERLFLDAVSLLHREERMMRRLAHLEFVPRVFDLFTEWEHTFLVEERLPGGTFQSFWSHNDNILSPFIRREQDRIPRFRRSFRTLGLGLLDMVERVHEAGVLLGDLSPNNVLLDQETMRMSLIDFESAVIPEEDREFMLFARTWLTPGFGNPGRRGRETLLPQDDLYAVAMLLFGAVVNVQPLFARKPEARLRFEEEFVRLGIPREWKDTVDALVDGDAALARRILTEWRLDDDAPADASFTGSGAPDETDAAARPISEPAVLAA